MLAAACQGEDFATPAAVSPETATDQTAQALMLNQQQKLVSPKPMMFGSFGIAGALSRSGHTAVIGSTLRPIDADNPWGILGAAYVYTSDKGVLELQAELLPEDGAPSASSFGWPDVALSGDTVLVSALGSYSGRTSPGAAYVFSRHGSTWRQEAKLVAPASEISFGLRLYLDGDTALVGAPGSFTGGLLTEGVVYVYFRRRGTWSLQQKLTSPTGAVASYFGYGLAGSGDTLLVGAPFEADAKTGQRIGAVHVFHRQKAGFSYEQTLTPNHPTDNEGFGSTVAMTDANVLIGAPSADTAAAPQSGAVYLFTKKVGSWTQEAELTSADAATRDGFGLAIALHGKRLIVGAPFAAAAGPRAGAAYVFRRHGATFRQQAKLVSTDLTSGDAFGAAVSVSADEALITAPAYGADHSGAVYRFGP